MFLKPKDTLVIDLSLELRDRDDWKIGTLRTFDYPLAITALAIEPLSGLLAVGTKDGTLYIFGSPGVETRLKLPDSVGVKFLQFSVHSFQLLCLDENNVLQIWTLASYGQPKLLKSVRFDVTSALTVSPSHDHAFLSLNSGEVKTYDLLCLRKSPYTIPNAWKLYEEKTLASHFRGSTTLESHNLVDVVIHPRNLNYLFAAYGGGVVIVDLENRDTIRAYELIIPPGAPGTSGYGSPDLMALRAPVVTALSIHPSGHLLVVGHADGSIAFWAIDDEETPLLVRTLDELDINIVDVETLENLMHANPNKESSVHEREPIIKLSWSGFSNSDDPRGGKTTLAILGGSNIGEPPGLTVIQLPALNPAEPPPELVSDQQTLNPIMRSAMRQSLDPLESYFYASQGPIQDHLLIPRENPYFSGHFDPFAIILLVEGVGGTRVVQAWEYPPPAFWENTDGAKDDDGQKKDPVDSLSDTLTSILQTLEITDEPRPLELPAALSIANAGLEGGQLLTVESDTYKRLVDERRDGNLSPRLPLKGGLAWSDESKAGDLKLAKHQSHRILITHSRDLTVRFYDISAQLLIGLQPNPIQHPFPNPLDTLTIDLKSVLQDPDVTQTPFLPPQANPKIDSVFFSPEALETVVALRTGELLVCRLSGSRRPGQKREVPDKEIIVLDHIASLAGFAPYFLLVSGLGLVQACATSDIGFLAVAYRGCILVVDLRVPRIIFQYKHDKSKGKHLIGLHSHRPEPDVVTSLLWTIGPLANDPNMHIRLLVTYDSGELDIFTVTQSASVWQVHGPITFDGGVPHSLPRGCFVIDSKSGQNWSANKARLRKSMSKSTAGTISSAGILVIAGTKGAKCIARINGERIGKAEWGSKAGNVLAVHIVERMGSRVLAVVTDLRQALIYSLPHLELLHILELPSIIISSFTMDDSGDFLAFSQDLSSSMISRAQYGTLFDIRRVYELADVDFGCTKPVVPPPPPPVSMSPLTMLNQLGSWLSLSQPMSGSRLDEILGGRDRPLPMPESQSSWNLPDTSAITAGVSGVAAAAASTQSTLYEKLTSAAGERGQLLSELENRFNALEEGSKNMVAQAKRLAAEQTAKSWFGF